MTSLTLFRTTKIASPLALLAYNSLLTEPPGFLHQHKSGLPLKSFTCFPVLLGQTTMALPWPRRPSTWDRRPLLQAYLGQLPPRLAALQVKGGPVSGFLHLFFPLPGMLVAQFFACMSHFHPFHTVTLDFISFITSIIILMSYCFTLLLFVYII